MTAFSFTRIDSVMGRVSVSEQQRLDDRSFDAPAETRSGLATAAGFAGLALIFSRFSIAPLIWVQFPGVFDLSRPEEAVLAKLFLVLIPVPGLVAPLALWLGGKAWSDLKHHTDKTGKFQTGFALTIGFVGTLILLSEIVQVTLSLMFF